MVEVAELHKRADRLVDVAKTSLQESNFLDTYVVGEGEIRGSTETGLFTRAMSGEFIGQEGIGPTEACREFAATFYESIDDKVGLALVFSPMRIGRGNDHNRELIKISLKPHLKEDELRQLTQDDVEVITTLIQTRMMIDKHLSAVKKTKIERSSNGETSEPKLDGRQVFLDAIAEILKNPDQFDLDAEVVADVVGDDPETQRRLSKLQKRVMGALVTISIVGGIGAGIFTYAKNNPREFLTYVSNIAKVLGVDSGLVSTAPLEIASDVAAEITGGETRLVVTESGVDTSDATIAGTEILSTLAPGEDEDKETFIEPDDNEPDSEDESSSISEYLFGEVYESIYEARQTRLGIRENVIPPEGMTVVTLEGETFYVPTELVTAEGGRWQFLYAPSTFEESMGVTEDMSSAERSALLESKIGDGRINILLGGVDFRPEDARGFGFAGRTDAMQVLSFDVQTGEVTIISISREVLSPEVRDYFGNRGDYTQMGVSSWVHGPDSEHLYRTDPAFQRMVIENALGIPIDGVTSFSFQAAENIVAELYPEGMEITLEEPIPEQRWLDNWSLPAGTHVLNAEDIIKFIRVREGTSGGDLTRQGRQSEVLGLLMSGVMSRVQENPLEALGLLQGLTAQFEAMEANTDALGPAGRTDVDQGYVDSFGVPMTLMLGQLEQATSVENGVALLSLYNQPESQAMIDNLITGELFSRVQVTAADVNNSGATYLEYWQPIRDRVAVALGGVVPSEEVSLNTATEDNSSNILWQGGDISFREWLETDIAPTMSALEKQVISAYIGGDGEVTLSELQTARAYFDQVFPDGTIPEENRTDEQQRVINVLYGDSGESLRD